MGPQKRFSRSGHIFFEQNSLRRIKMPFVPPVNTRQCGDLNNKWLTAGPYITGLQSSRNAVKSSVSGHCSVQTESTRKCFTKVPETANIQADSFFQPFSLPGKSRRSLNGSGSLLLLIFWTALSLSLLELKLQVYKKKKHPPGCFFFWYKARVYAAVT